MVDFKIVVAFWGPLVMMTAQSAYVATRFLLLALLGHHELFGPRSGSNASLLGVDQILPKLARLILLSRVIGDLVKRPQRACNGPTGQRALGRREGKKVKL